MQQETDAVSHDLHPGRDKFCSTEPIASIAIGNDCGKGKKGEKIIS